MRSLTFITLGALLLLQSCSSEKKSEKEETEKKKTELKDPELQKMMNDLESEAVSEDNLADGYHELLYPNGKLKSTGTISNGKKEGLWSFYHEDGRKWSECNFQAGESHGKVVSYHPNGQVNYIGYFTGGEKSGKWQFYDLDGKLIKEVDMTNKEK